MSSRSHTGVHLKDSAETAPRAGPLARVSIEHKLPLLFGSVLLAVILTLSASAVVEMRRTTLQAASDRSASLTQQFATLFQQAGAPLRALAVATAAKSELRLFATSPDEHARAAALQALEYHGPQPEQVVATELRDRNGAIALSTSKDTVGADLRSPRDQSWLLAGDSAFIGPFRSIGKVSAFPVVAPVPGTSGFHVVYWRRMASSRSGREQLKHLIGSEATLYLGNVDGSYVTDLEQNVTAIVLNRDAFRSPQVESRPPVQGSADRSRYLVSWAAVPRTPWAVGVELPMDVILAPVDGFIRRMARLALGALAAGLFVAWVMSRRLTGPLRQLAVAAEAMSGGDYSQAVIIERSDELGRLGKSFNRMAAEVAQSRHGLEAMVAERTHALNDAMHQLHDAQESLVRREKLAMLGQLAGGVGHELRNPLGVMTNAIYYLKAVLTSAPPTVGEYLDIVQQQIALSEKIVSDLLDFARQKPPIRMPASLAEVASDQIARLGPTNGVVISTELPPNLPPVLVDRTQVGQIMQNLLMNAMQAMNHSGQITIRAHVERSLVHVDVRDTGPGVSPTNSDKIFEPLFTTKAGGIGLGLPLSRTAPPPNEGDLTLRVTSGAGADFRLSLPVALPS
jgi:signal transduction histidine kinase